MLARHSWPIKLLTYDIPIRGRPRHQWMQQLEVDTGLAAYAAWDTASDRVVWRAQRPTAGQVSQ